MYKTNGRFNECWGAAQLWFSFYYNYLFYIIFEYIYITYAG